MDGMSVILGNGCSVLAMVTDSVSATRKTPKGVLLVQCVSQLIYCTGAILLRGYSAAVQNAVSILRNLVAIFKVESKVIEGALLVLGVVLGIVFNNLGLMGLLPVVANLQYTLAVFRFKDNERALKISFAVCIGMFVIFNLAILNYVGAVSNFVVAVSTVLALLKQKKST